MLASFDRSKSLPMYWQAFTWVGCDYLAQYAGSMLHAALCAAAIEPTVAVLPCHVTVHVAGVVSLATMRGSGATIGEGCAGAGDGCGAVGVAVATSGCGCTSGVLDGCGTTGVASALGF